MKVVIAGGTGQVGRILDRALTRDGHEVVVLTRSPVGARQVRWDGSTLGAWSRQLDGSDVVVNLAGRSVSCRYTAENLAAMMSSRVDSARVVGEAVAAAARPPKVWLQMSTATIYAHRFDAANDEASGRIGGAETGVPGYWAYSVDIARNWEAEQERAVTPGTRKVALRAAMVMSPDRGGVFDVLSWLARLGLGGPVAGGRQYISWIHDHDFVRAVRFLIRREDIAGAVNLAAPGPLPQREFMRILRSSWRMPVDCRRPGGWPGSARPRSARTPNCCSRAGGWCRDGWSRRASRSTTRTGRRRPGIWCRAAAAGRPGRPRTERRRVRTPAPPRAPRRRPAGGGTP